MNAEKRYFIIRYTCIIGTIIFGSGSTIITKRLDIINFYYPLFQTGIMFLGEFICCIIIFLVSRLKKETEIALSSSSRLDNVPKNCFEKTGKFGFIFCALFDFIGAFLEYFSYNLLKASSIVTFKMMVIIFIISYRVYFLKKPIYRHQKLGLLFLGIGFLVVGVEVCFGSRTQIKWNATAGIGIILMIFAQVFNAIVIIAQEYQLSRVQTTPEVAISIQGSAGLVLCTILYVPIKYIFASMNYNTADIQTPFQQMAQDTQICSLILSLVVVVGMLNYFQCKTIKVADSLALCTIDSGRVILVWILAIAFSFETALPIEIVGGSSLIFGILIYNEVVIIPCCGMKKSAKVSMKESEIYRELKIKDRLWQNNFNSIV